jgi:hypothetical protein
VTDAAGGGRQSSKSATRVVPDLVNPHVRLGLGGVAARSATALATASGGADQRWTAWK